MAETVVSRWGNSHAIRLPQTMMKELRISEGDKLSVTLESGRLVLTPLFAPSLEELVARMTPQNRHDETDVGPARGREIW